MTMMASQPEAAAATGTPDRAARNKWSTDPVFVLCAGRSGSTLLRFILDAHPDLACPPETNVPALCGQLATVWSLIEGAPLSQNRGDEPPEIPDAAIAGVRETMDRMTGSYLARRGKKRYCDKSLGTARFAYLMQRIWPEAQFICLFRHPMDVIASGMEACPWGLNGYGFDPYIAETPGNSVFALARFWADNTSTILAAEKEYGDRCHRVRYEDLVSDPQAVADNLYEFLGVAPVPGIAEAIFAAERERFGPADYKIWHTSRISDDSVGRGWTIPAGLIGPEVRTAINEFCGRLGYVPVDDYWGDADRPADLRLPSEAQAADGEQSADHGEQPGIAATAPAGPPRTDVAPDPEFARVVGERLEAGTGRLSEGFTSRWAPCTSESFEVVATPAAGRGPNARWLVDLAAGTVTVVTDTGPDDSDDDEEPDTDWEIIASVDTWEQLIAGSLNMSVALRRHQLRYLEQGEAGPTAADTRLAMLADLLGLTSWGRARSVSPPRPPAAAASPAGQEPS
jgi:Sulfotransferase family